MLSASNQIPCFFFFNRQFLWLVQKKTGSVRKPETNLNFALVLSVCFNATVHKVFSYPKMEMGSLTNATILVDTVHPQATPSWMRLLKFWLKSQKNWKMVFTLSQFGDNSNPRWLFSLDHRHSKLTTEQEPPVTYHNFWTARHSCMHCMAHLPKSASKHSTGKALPNTRCKF